MAKRGKCRRTAEVVRKAPLLSSAGFPGLMLVERTSRVTFPASSVESDCAVRRRVDTEGLAPTAHGAASIREGRNAGLAIGVRRAVAAFRHIEVPAVSSVTRAINGAVY